MACAEVKLRRLCGHWWRSLGCLCNLQHFTHEMWRLRWCVWDLSGCGRRGWEWFVAVICVVQRWGCMDSLMGGSESTKHVDRGAWIFVWYGWWAAGIVAVVARVGQLVGSESGRRYARVRRCWCRPVLEYGPEKDGRITDSARGRVRMRMGAICRWISAWQ